MNKKTLCVLFIMFVLVLLVGCTNEELEEASQAVEVYNNEVQIYNERVEEYNAIIDDFENANASLTDATNKAQEIINMGDVPYDENTLTDLKDAMANAGNAKTSIPDRIEKAEILSVNDNMKKNELKELKSFANDELNRIKNYEFPSDPEIPDYTEEISSINNALSEYQDSIKAMKQITAPSDDFVMERLQRVDTITMMAPVTENHDPNGLLHKQGGYIGCIYFRDSQVNQSLLYVDGDPDDVVDVGTQGGGAIEIFDTNEEAVTRDTYLASFDGTIVASGSHYVIGTVLIRTSNELTGTQQLELTDKIKLALTQID